MAVVFTSTRKKLSVANASYVAYNYSTIGGQLSSSPLNKNDIGGTVYEIVEKNVDGIVLCLFELVVGVLPLINPISFTIGIIMVAGVVLILLGLINVSRYFRISIDKAVLGQM